MADAQEAGAVAELVHPLAPTAEVPQDTGEPVAEAAEQAEAEGGAEEPEKEEKPSRTYTQDEVDKILRKARRNAAYTARRETEAQLYQRMAEERAQQGAQRPAEAASTEPKREQFDSYEDYLEARADWRAEQKVEAKLREQQQQGQRHAQAATQEQQVARFHQQMEKARESVADFDDVMEAASEAPLTPTMRDAILESDVGALLAYHLAKQPAEANRIARLSPARQAMALGALEAALQTRTPPATSKAPPPIKPLGGGSGGTRDPAKMSMDEYMAHRAKQGASWARR